MLFIWLVTESAITAKVPGASRYAPWRETLVMVAFREKHAPDRVST